MGAFGRREVWFPCRLNVGSMWGLFWGESLSMLLTQGLVGAGMVLHHWCL